MGSQIHFWKTKGVLLQMEEEAVHCAKVWIVEVVNKLLFIGPKFDELKINLRLLKMLVPTGLHFVWLVLNYCLYGAKYETQQRCVPHYLGVKVSTFLSAH